MTKNIPFPGKTSRDYALKIPNFPRKWEHACDRLMHSSGRGGGGGGGVDQVLIKPFHKIAES